MHRNGFGVPQNYKIAVKWYTIAAKQGNALAQFNLGVVYGDGEGVQQNNRTAVKWYRLAANQGDSSAQTNLGAMYAFGTGVLKDYVEAYKWGNLAAANGNKKGAKLRDFVEKKMTPTQIETAQRLARECVKNKYKGC
jgi:hypothetical protein